MSDDFDQRVKTFDKWFKRGAGFFVFWFIFCFVLVMASLAGSCWVIYKLLIHFSVI